MDSQRAGDVASLGNVSSNSVQPRDAFAHAIGVLPSLGVFLYLKYLPHDLELVPMIAIYLTLVPTLGVSVVLFRRSGD